MKLDTTDNTTTIGNVNTDDSVDMKITDSAMAHITKLLKNLYNDPMLATFREYTANALDAHTAAGNTDPIELYLPTYDTPVFTVKDYGVGMSTDNLRKIYSQFGESTKNQANNEIGGFGLGCKSGLAIASQFTVISTQDGVRSTAIVSNNEDGLAKLSIVDVRMTSEPDGTSVAVPINNVTSFRDKAKTYFPFFVEGTVKDYENGIPEHFTKKYAGDLISTFESAEQDTTVYTYLNIYDPWINSSGVILLMGGIPYTISQDDMKKNLTGSALDFLTLFRDNLLMVIDAPIGSVKLSPSREGIQFNANTKDFFQEMFTEAASNFITEALEGIESADSFENARARAAALPYSMKDNRIIEWDGISTRGVRSTFSLRNEVHAVSMSYYDQILSNGASTLRFEPLNSSANKSLEFVYGSVSNSTARRYLGTYFRDVKSDLDRYRTIVYIKTDALKKDESFDLDAFKESLVFTPERFHEEDTEDGDNYQSTGEAKYQKLTLEDVARVHCLGEDFASFTSFDSIKKSVNTIRAKKAKETRDAGKKDVVKPFTDLKYLSLKAGETKASGVSVPDIKELKGIVLVTKQNVSNWYSGSEFLESLIGSFDFKEISPVEASVMGKMYKGQTLVFVTGSRSSDHAKKLFGDLKITEFDAPTFMMSYATEILKAVDKRKFLRYAVGDVVPNFTPQQVATIKDPELRKLLSMESTDTYVQELRSAVRNGPNNSVEGLVDPPITKYIASYVYVTTKALHHYYGIDKLLTKYPLLSLNFGQAKSDTLDHAIMYMNAIHSKNKTKCFDDIFIYDATKN